MIQRFRNILFLLIFSSMTLFGQETLPPYHWANDVIDYLKVAGYLPGIDVNQRPLERDAIARELLNIGWQQQLSAKDRSIIRLLYREFSPEIAQLARLGDWRELFNTAMGILKLPLEIPDRSTAIKPGFFGELYLQDSRDTDTQTEYDAHATVMGNLNQSFTFYSNLRVFSDAPSTYIGKEYRNLYGYMEQGYLQYRQDWLSIKVGRDWLQSGPGRDAQLLFSANSRPFDMYHLKFGKSVLQFSFWGMQLDRQRIIEDRSYIANRYLNGHSLRLNLRNRIYIGISEVALYGGENRSWEMGFVNPLSFYYLYNLNQEVGGTNANVLYTIDWDLYIFPQMNIYGEFLIDDYQVDNEAPGDLEPAELGLLLGFQWANPAGFSGSKLHLAYTQVRNRTYNVAAPPFGKYLHRNEEIGHYLGNNFWQLALDLDYWLKPELQLTGFTRFTKQGEGSVAGVFNEDFLNFMPEEGYDEPFPFGIVERDWQSGVRVFYKPHHLAYLRFDLTYSDISNFQHFEGQATSDMQLRIAAGWEWEKLWR